jgi:hypothetical protein
MVFVLVCASSIGQGIVRLRVKKLLWALEVIINEKEAIELGMLDVTEIGERSFRYIL